MILKNESVKEFLIKNTDKRLICFGASQMFLDMCSLYEDQGIINKIIGVVDNDKKKQHTVISFKGKDFPIYSLDELKKIVNKNTVIIITAGYFYGIINQLDGIKELDDTECYIYPIMHYTKRQPEIVDILTGEDKIPKVIHYCWFGRKQIPKIEKRCIDSWRKMCPDFEIKEWTEKNYDISKINYTKEAYEKGQFAFVSDYARLDIVFRYGGIYFDTDVELLRPIDSLLKYSGFAAFQHNPRVATGLGIGAVKGMDIIRELKEYYHDIHFSNKDGSQNTTPCTVYQREVLLKYGLQENGKAQIIGGLQIFPQDYFQPRCPITGIINMTPFTYAIHHSRESWASKINAQKRENTLKMMENIRERLNKGS